MLDARLVPAAVCCWGATIVAVVAGWRAGVWVAVGCGVVAIGLWWWGIRRSENRRGENRRRGLVLVLLAAVVAGAGYGVAGAWREYRVQAHPLRSAVGEEVWVTVVAADDPKELSARWFGGRKLLMEGKLVEFRRGAEQVRGGGGVVVLASKNGWRDLVPGQEVVFRARVDRPWGSDLTVAVLRAEGPPTRSGLPPWWQRAAGEVRGDFADAAGRALSAEAAGLLPGLVLGDTSRLAEQVRKDFRETGLAHLTAVSGANITILLGAVLLSMRALTVDPRVGAVAAAVALLMFVVLARPSPSVLRAAVMGAIALLALVTSRRNQALPALCAAVIGLIGWSPGLAVDIGFALSVLATAGLVLLAPGWSEWLRAHGCWRAMADAVAISAAAFVVTTPIVIALTGRLSLVAIAANVLVAPVIAPITVLGAIGAALSPVWPSLAELVLHCTAPPLWWLLTVSERAAALGASVTLPTGIRSGLVAAVSCTVVLLALEFRWARTTGGDR
ncbi:ComEC/Rec2 family competence protein [Nocardia sp. NPDC127526]|uniref:ComEC/Rec2 family competence protein n=1 Tax=Nocardia sp. NPDC127526 TaxID=3345393 RepID=UPI003628CCE6